MCTCSGRTLLVAAIVAGSLVPAARAGAQTRTATRDSAPHFALFGGRAAAESRGPENGFLLGVSGDFRWRPVPVPLRLSVSFSQQDQVYYAAKRGASSSLELVMRPVPKKFGIQPYFLGGVGVATRTGYTTYVNRYTLALDGTMQPQYYRFDRARETWAFASAGIGLDIGRAFIQLKVENPVASTGPILIPLNVGFRFWD